MFQLVLSSLSALNFVCGEAKKKKNKKMKMTLGFVHSASMAYRTTVRYLYFKSKEFVSYVQLYKLLMTTHSSVLMKIDNYGA